MQVLNIAAGMQLMHKVIGKQQPKLFHFTSCIP